MKLWTTSQASRGVWKCRSRSTNHAVRRRRDSSSPWRTCDAGLPSAASGIRNWGFLCGAARRRRCPPTEGAAQVWPTFSPPGRTVAVYLAHLGKARLLPGLDTRWRNKAVTSASDGLAEAGDGSYCLGPAIARQRLTQIVSTPGWRGRPTRIAVISATFLLRVHPEFLPVTRQRAGGDPPPRDNWKERRLLG